MENHHYYASIGFPYYNLVEWVGTLVTLLGGGAVGAIITSTMNWFSKKRQREQDIWKLKM